MRKTKLEKLQDLKAQAAQSIAAAKLVESQIKAQDEKKLTAKAIVLGKLVLEHGMTPAIHKLLDEKLKTKAHRSLFELPPGNDELVSK